MSNPWLKKNPFISIWLSEANRIAGTVRSQAAAQAKRQINAAVTKATKDNLKTLLGETASALSAAKPKRRR